MTEEPGKHTIERLHFLSTRKSHTVEYRGCVSQGKDEHFENNPQ